MRALGREVGLVGGGDVVAETPPSMVWASMNSAMSGVSFRVGPTLVAGR